MPYREDLDALVAQCDSLRSELARAEVDAKELERLRGELTRKTRELEKLRAHVDPTLAARRRTRVAAIAASVLGVAAGVGVWTVVLRAAPEPASAPAYSSSRQWFDSARPHCNPLEVRDHLSRAQPPQDSQAPGYLATCWALGGQIEEARRVLASAGPDRAQGLQILFDIAHPIADRGDDLAAGPIMGLVMEEWPENYMATYHAGISDFASGNVDRARQRLRRFQTLYRQPDGWSDNARRALEGIETGRTFAQVFQGGPDPRIE